MPTNRTKSKPSTGPARDVANAAEKILAGFNKSEYDGNPLSLMNHLATKDPAELDALIAAISGMQASDIQLETFDYTKVPIRKDSFWVLQLETMGFQGPGGRFEPEYFPGSTPTFCIIIYDDRSSFLVQENMLQPGLPTSDFVIKCIKKAIASPLPPNRPSLPSLLLLAFKLSPHVPALKPFLDSLPKPFKWRIETPEEAEEVASGVHDLNVAGVTKGITTAESEKALGNGAVARKDREAAVMHYSRAIESLLDALAQKPTDEEKERCNTLLGICFGNRAAAWLLEGEGCDPEKALKDAEKARVADENYAKAYYRQAKAYQLLSDRFKAIDILTEASRKPNLASDKGLNDALIDAYGGFPEGKEELRAFCRDIFVSDDGDKRARGLTEFERRATVHVRKVFGASASIRSI